MRCKKIRDHVPTEEFTCDITSATVPVWSYHETVPSGSLPYQMGYQADLNLNAASYTVMMWLKQGASEPDDAIIIGQHIGTSTTTTMTSVTVTETTVTVSTTSTTQSTTKPDSTSLSIAWCGFCD